MQRGFEDVRWDPVCNRDHVVTDKDRPRFGHGFVPPPDPAKLDIEILEHELLKLNRSGGREI
jgi:hypothetical protein